MIYSVMGKKYPMLSLSLSLLFFVMQVNSCAPFENNTPTEPISEQGYKDLKASLAQERDSLATVFKGLTADEQPVYLKEVVKPTLRDHLENDLIPCWYGTTWDFNGISQVPGEGEIACGYFVSTLLRDLGYSLERYKLAQQASLNIVKSLSPKDQRWDWSGISRATLTEKVKGLSKGFYVVGLDFHVGFLLHDDDGRVWFLHSSYLDPVAVVRENALTSEALASDRYVLGYLESDWLVKKWLLRTKIATVKG